MYFGGYNLVEPENIHASNLDRDEAEALIERAAKQDEHILSQDRLMSTETVAHMVAMAKASLEGSHGKQTFVAKESGYDERCYLLLAQQLKGKVSCDLYFPEHKIGRSMIKAFTGIDYDVEATS